MMEILRDWGFWGFVIMVVTLIVMIYLGKLQLARKSLTCTIIGENTSLMKPDPKLVDETIQLKQAFPDEKISFFFETSKTILLRIENNGFSSILRSDFETPLDICFGESAQILEWAIIKTSPRNLHPQIKKDTNKLSLAPCLMNMSDYLTIAASVRGYENLLIDGRIVGIPEIRQAVSLHPIRRAVLLGTFGLICNSFGLPFIFSLPLNIVLRIVLMIILGLATSSIFINHIQKNIYSVYMFQEALRSSRNIK